MNSRSIETLYYCSVDEPSFSWHFSPMKISDLSSVSFLPSSSTELTLGNLDGEARLKLLMESATDDGLILLDVNGCVESHNVNAAKMQGYLNEEIVGKHFSILYMLTDVRKDIPRKHLELARKYGRVEEDIHLVKKGGEYFLAKIIITTLKDDFKNVIGFSLIIRDQTKYKEIENKLRHGEALARKVFDAIKDYGVLILDLDGKVMSWNEGARSITGYEAQEVIGRHFSILLPAESSQDKSRYEICETLNTGRYVEDGWRTRKDGSRFWANVLISTIKDDNQVVIGFTKVMRDMTDRKRAEDLFKMAYSDLERKIDQRTNELMTANVKLQEAIKTRDEFLNIASHELKTPLTPLKLQTQIIKKRVKDGTFKDLNDAQLSRIMDVLEVSVNRINALVENLLDVSRISLERMNISKERINLSKVFKDLFERYQSTIALNKTEVKLNIEDEIIGDFDLLRIEQVFLNLLMNSLKYGEQRPVEIRVYKGEEFAYIEFIDQGTGISESSINKIFTRYERLDVHKNVSGLGLGLYITKEIVESHGGTISVESEESKGSVFKVSLPLPAKAFI